MIASAWKGSRPGTDILSSASSFQTLAPGIKRMDYATLLRGNYANVMGCFFERLLCQLVGKQTLLFSKAPIMTKMNRFVPIQVG